MEARRVAALWVTLLPVAALAAAANDRREAAAAAPRRAEPQLAALCTGDYADFLTSMSRETRAFEASADAGYTYCIRATATYEHVYFGNGGKLRRRYVRHVRHGTGFAYKAKDGEWYVATNEHVAQHPLVTDSDADVGGVPAGSRKVRETGRIGRDEGGDGETSQRPLTKV